jgi:hypothetical protein
MKKGKEVEIRGAGVASLFIYMGIRPSPPFLSFDLFSESFRARKKQAPPPPPFSFNTKYQVRRETGRENFTFTFYIFFLHFINLYIQTYITRSDRRASKILARNDDIHKDSRKCHAAGCAICAL